MEEKIFACFHITDHPPCLKSFLTALPHLGWSLKGTFRTHRQRLLRNGVIPLIRALDTSRRSEDTYLRTYITTYQYKEEH